MASKEKELNKLIVDEVINHILETLDSTIEKETGKDRQQSEVQNEVAEQYYILQLSRLFRYSSSCCEDLYIRDTSSEDEEQRWFNVINSETIMRNAVSDDNYNTKNLDEAVNEELRKAGCLFTQEKIDKYCPLLNICKVPVDKLHNRG